MCIIMIGSCFLIPSKANEIDSDSGEDLQPANIAMPTDDGTYDVYISNHSTSPLATEELRTEIDADLVESPIVFNVTAEQDGFYTVGMSYLPLDTDTVDIKVGMKIDGEYPYTDAERFTFPRMWKDADTTNNKDDYGNEFSAQQVPYEELYYNTTINENTETGEEFLVHLSAGEHQIEIIPVLGEIKISQMVFGILDTPLEYKKPADNSEFYDGEPIVIEGEKADIKSSYFLVGKSDNSSVKVTPHSSKVNLVNYVGGGNWKEIGDTLVWNTPELEAGYYQIGFSYRQNSVIGGKVYRSLMVDGKVPFKEAEAIGFSYDDDWQQKIYDDQDNSPYLIYLSEGTHQIALRVTAGDMGDVRTMLMEAVSSIGNLYIDMTVITGEKVDLYRDYELFKKIPNMEERLVDASEKLTKTAERLQEVTGEKSGSNYSVIMNMVEVINQMLENKFEAHRYKDYYYKTYCSLSSVLQELRSMPLSLDKIVLTKQGEEQPFEKISFFEKTIFGVQRFITSFSKDYNGVSSSSGSDSITIWVNWGRDQAQVLSSLVKRSFVPETGIEVNINLTNASIIQATLSGNGPDVILQHSRSEPVNLAMRGVLYDLTEFEDCNEVLERFQDGADVPYRYEDGLYALPDTQTFYMMFYREDILEQYGVQVPQTWEEFEEAAKLLMRHNMTVWMQNTPATSLAQTNVGVGSNNLYPSMLLQRGLSLYEEDGKSTTLLSSGSMETFEYWSNYYTKLKLPVTLDFYNRFRVGTTPLGIMPYTFYTTLKVAAPEIDGLWGMTKIPGTVQEDGSISQVSSGGGTGCAILKQSDNPEAAWEFLKWWTSAETQSAFSNDVESIIGPSGRVALSNVDAISTLAWDEGKLDELLQAWDEVEEIPEFPGSYYVSRSIYQCFWNVVNDQQNTKNMLMRFGKEANQEIERKWRQYQGR